MSDIELDPHVLATLRRLHALAARCRGNTAADAPERVASRELTRTIAMLRECGVSRAEIAAAIGVSPRAITQRLRAHGVLKTPPSLLRFETRVATPRRTHCKRGHAFTPENTYTYGQTRQCRACIRINYERRKAS